tara:strand:+ start:4671 stop:5267 length:597 start_codon:yes stop_codon:yes gene_type:complete
MAFSYYKEEYDRKFEPGAQLPTVSTGLDSVRTYQFEVHFHGLPDGVSSEKNLTLAAKKITGIGIKNNFISVDRVNDKLYYPGKVQTEDLKITFDNLYLQETASDLWRYFKSIYDPLTGEMTQDSEPGGPSGKTFKANRMEIIQLDNTMTPHSTVELMGVWPVQWKAAEFNYSTNDFHTLEIDFKYDFIHQYDYSNPPA